MTTKDSGTVTVPHEFVQALEFFRTPRSVLPPDKFRGLTTLPRTQESNPPTHLVRSRSGDFLRGRLVSLDEENAQMAVEAGRSARPVTFPRSDLATLIWLHPENMSNPWQPPMPTAAGDLPMEAVTGETTRVWLLANGIEGNCLLGTKPPIGPCRIDLETVRVLLIGGASDGVQRTIAFSKWRLVPALDPRNLPLRKRAVGGKDSLQKPSATDAEPAAETDRTAIDSASLAEADRLASARDRRAVAAYTRLLTAEDRDIRARSIAQLRTITGSTLPYAVDDTSANRESAAREWRRWAACQAISAPLRFP